MAVKVLTNRAQKARIHKRETAPGPSPNSMEKDDEQLQLRKMRSHRCTTRIGWKRVEQETGLWRKARARKTGSVEGTGFETNCGQTELRQEPSLRAVSAFRQSRKGKGVKGCSFSWYGASNALILALPAALSGYGTWVCFLRPR